MERLRSHREFVAVLRGRRRVARDSIVVHYLVRDGAHAGDAAAEAGTSVRRRVGLAVAKSVGNAVARNTVKRRFRVLARRYEDLLPADCDVVMRAMPGTVDVPFAELDAQVASAFRGVARKAAKRG